MTRIHELWTAKIPPQGVSGWLGPGLGCLGDRSRVAPAGRVPPESSNARHQLSKEMSMADPTPSADLGRWVKVIGIALVILVLLVVVILIGGGGGHVPPPHG